MSNQFLDILEKCRIPTITVMREALAKRPHLSTTESNFITYMAGFSHNEFAQKLFDEFGLAFIENTAILFDRFNNKFHIKILLNDLSVDLQSLDMGEISQRYQLPIFTSSTPFRNKDGSFIANANFKNETKNLNGSQLAEYMSHHIAGLREDVISYPVSKNDINFVVHITTVSQRNTFYGNLNLLFNKASACLIANYPDDLPNVSLKNHQIAEEAYPLMSKVKWYVVDRDSPEEVTSFLEKIGAEYRLVPYLGDEYDYLSYLISEIEDFMMKHCQNVV